MEEAVVRFSRLSEDMATLIKKYGANSIVDLSGIPKRMMLELFFACKMENIERVYLFELRKIDKNNRINNVYHNLAKSLSNYSYTNLMESRNVKENFNLLEKKPKTAWLYLIISLILILTTVGFYFYYKQKKVFYIIFQSFTILTAIVSIIGAWGTYNFWKKLGIKK